PDLPFLGCLDTALNDKSELLLSRYRNYLGIRPLVVLADHEPQADRLARGQLDRGTLAGEGFIVLLFRHRRVDVRRHVRLVDAGEPEAVAPPRLGDHHGPQLPLRVGPGLARLERGRLDVLGRPGLVLGGLPEEGPGYRAV